MQEVHSPDSVIPGGHAQQPLVSVILPCYNAAAFLKEALHSIINQTYRNLEIIVINDGSSDNTLEILETFMKSDSRIVLINHAINKGLVTSLNDGVARASGRFIARMDADDVSVLDRIEIQVHYLLDHPAVDVVSCGFYYISAKGNHSVSIRPKGTLPLALKFFSFFATPIAHACVVGKSECFKQFPYDNNYVHSEDYDLFSRMALSGKLLYNLSLPLYGIRMHQSRVSYRFEEQQVQSHLLISERNLYAYFNFRGDQEIHSIAVNRFSGSAGKQDILSAFNLIQKVREIYLSREHCSNQEKKEIDLFINEQRADVMIQAIKNAPIAGRLSLLALLFSFVPSFLKPELLRYLWVKVRTKISS